MAELTVKFKTSGFSSAARTLGRSFDTRYNDYQGIRNKVLEVSTSRNYLGTSGSYLQKKMDSLDSKRDKLKTFKTKVEDFCEEAKQVDKGVAKRIKSDAKSFYKSQGIKTGFFAAVATFFKNTGKAILNGLNDAWKAIKDTAKSAWQAVKEWYEKNKKTILTILTAIAAAVVIAALALFAPGVLLLIGQVLLAIGKTVGLFVGKLVLFNLIANAAIETSRRLLDWLGKRDRLVYTHKHNNPATWGKEPGTISAYEYALLANAAYEGPDARNSEKEILERYPDLKIRDPINLGGGFSCTVIEIDKDHAIVLFRGSDDWQDWVGSNIPSLTTGINPQAEAAKILIEGLPYSNIQVTGHSLGGYLAIEAALSSDKVTECVVFNALARNTGKELFQNTRYSERANKITQYRTSKDPASSSFVGVRIGKTVTVPFDGFNILKAHEIQNFTQDNSLDHVYPGRKTSYSAGGGGYSAGGGGSGSFGGGGARSNLYAI